MSLRCLTCHGDYIALTDDGGYCLQCRSHVFIYLAAPTQDPTP